MLTDALISHEEEYFVSLDRSANIPAEFIVLEGSLRSAGYIEVVPGVQRVVPKKFEGFTVKFIRARASCQVDDSACISAVLCGEGRVIHLEFFERGDGWLEGDLVLHRIVQVDAVDQPVGRVFPLARGVDGKRTLSAERRRQETIGRRRDRAGRQEVQIHEMTAIQWNFLYGL